MIKALQHFSEEQLRHGRSMTPEQVLQFLEDFAQLHAAREAGAGGSTQVNIRVPRALLRAFRARAAAAGVPYQTLIKRLMEEWVKGLRNSSPVEGPKRA